MQKDAVIFSLGNYSHLDSEIKHVFWNWNERDISFIANILTMQLSVQLR